MPYLTPADFNMSEGLHMNLVYVAEIVPIFIPLVLFAMFVIISFGTFFVQKRLGNSGDFPASFAVAGFVTSLTAIIMSTIEGIVNLSTLVVCIMISVIGVIWLYISRD